MNSFVPTQIFKILEFKKVENIKKLKNSNFLHIIFCYCFSKFVFPMFLSFMCVFSKLDTSYQSMVLHSNAWYVRSNHGTYFQYDFILWCIYFHVLSFCWKWVINHSIWMWERWIFKNVEDMKFYVFFLFFFKFSSNLFLYNITSSAGSYMFNAVIVNV